MIDDDDYDYACREVELFLKQKKAAIEKLKVLIFKAPHEFGCHCNKRKLSKWTCTCWKSEALDLVKKL